MSDDNNKCDCYYCKSLDDEFSDMPELEQVGETKNNIDEISITKIQDNLKKLLFEKLSNKNPIVLFIYSDFEYNKLLDFGTYVIDKFNNSLDIENSIMNDFIKCRTQFIDIYDNYINKFEPYLDKNITDGDYNINEEDTEIVQNEYNNLIKWKAIMEEEWIEW